MKFFIRLTKRTATIAMLFLLLSGNIFKHKLTSIEYYISSPSGGYYAPFELGYKDMNRVSVKKAFNEANYAAFCRKGDSSFLNDSLYEIFYSMKKIDSFILDSFFIENKDKRSQQEITKIILVLHSEEFTSVIKVDYNWNFEIGKKKYSLTKHFRRLLLEDMPCELRNEWENIGQ